MSAASSTFDFQAMRQELRGNPKTQVALAAFALVMIYALYTFLGPDAPKGKKAVAARAGANLDPRQLQGLRRLPDLAALGQAGELPPAAKVQRDLFMFEAPPRPHPRSLHRLHPSPRRKNSRRNGRQTRRPASSRAGPRISATSGSSRGLRPARWAPS
ncbi:MAG: hypothetical protein IPI84_14890 [Holophagaceae bacterium]|nr:hypothetical protein [Holophagaceae bacterium]